ncbi:hypothetical protein [uncultured Roseibium sp.]|uniref:hypothetical protein n=1 Tax=uncultured Roseibium sp. TaxID=1936171 RepID=UPI00261B9C20|nr:hypothetical protein [uncultured Roseibium sp.]
MARLDRYAGTQQLPGVRRAQVIADTSAAQATQQFGRQLQGVAGDVNRLGQQFTSDQQRIDDFERKRGLLSLEGQLAEGERTSLENLAPGAAGFEQDMLANFDKQAQAFLGAVPASARKQAQNDVQALRNRYQARYSATQSNEQKRYFEEGILESNDQLAKTIRSNPETYERSLARGRQMIEESGLDRIEKETALKAWKRMASLAWFETLPASERASLLQGSNVDALSLIRSKEGFREKAYADTGGPDGKQFSGWRAGFGSDTVTRADGSIVTVTENTVVTREDAERDLKRREANSRVSAIKSIGVDAWNAMPPRAQAALTSITYNYGELPKRLHAAAKSGDLKTLANAVLGLAGDNGGVNKARREQEAAIILGVAAIPNASPEVQQRLDTLSYEDQVKLYDQAQSDLVSVAADRMDGFRLQIATDPLSVERQQILADPMLDDGQKAVLIKAHDGALKSGERQREAIDWANAPQKSNPLDPEARKSAELMFQQATEAGADPDAVARTLVSGKGVVARPYVNMIRNGLNSRNAQEVGQAYRRAVDLYGIDEQAVVGAENGAALEEAALKWRFYREKMGLGEDEAAQRLAELNSPDAQERRKLLLESDEYKAADKKLDAGTIAGLFDEGWLSFAPDVGSNPKAEIYAVGEFKRIYAETFAETGGEPDLAKELAFKRFSRSWGVSDYSAHGDGVVIKYAAENLHPPIGESYGYIRDEALSLLEENGVDASEVFLEFNPTYTLQDMRSSAGNQALGPRMTLQYRRGEDGPLEYWPVAFRVDVAGAHAAFEQQQEDDQRAQIERWRAERDRKSAAPSRYERQKKRGAGSKPDSETLKEAGIALKSGAAAVAAAVDGGIDAVVDAFPDRSSRGNDPRSRRSFKHRDKN